MSSSDAASFAQTMMRACWFTAVAYISYNIILKCTCGERWPPPAPGECIDTYQDVMCAECMDPSQECTGALEFGGEADYAGRDTCCEPCEPPPQVAAEKKNLCLSKDKLDKQTAEKIEAEKKRKIAEMRKTCYSEM